MKTLAKNPKPFEELDSNDDFICQQHERLFILAADIGFDELDFIEKFMLSDFCKREWDSFYSFFHMADPEDTMDYVLREINPVKSKKHYNSNVIGWIGYMYRYFQFRTGLYSKQIYKNLPVTDMLVFYEGMHTQDYEYFLNVVQERLERGE